MIQSNLLNLAGTGLGLKIAPIHIAPFLDWCAAEKLDPAAAPTRSQYAGVQAGRGQTMAWPPGRNEACWCGSGRKYKKCCGTVEPAPLQGGKDPSEW